MLGKVERFVRSGALVSAVQPEVGVVAAAGTSQSTATLLAFDINIVKTATYQTACCVRLPSGATIGDSIMVINRSGTSINVYTETNGKINSGTVNAAYSLSDGAQQVFYCVTAGVAPEWTTFVPKITMASLSLASVPTRRRVALLGDSIASQNTVSTATAVSYDGKGWLTHAQMRLGQPWYLPLANNFAVTGTTVDVMIQNQLPLLLAEHAVRPITRVFISAGTNDAYADRTFTQITNDLSTLFGSILDAGITPVHIGILPRGADASANTNVNRKRNALRVNDWMSKYSYVRGGLEFIDCSDDIADNSTAFGNALTTMTDGTQLHPIELGSFYMGQRIANYYTARGIGANSRFAATRNDIYDATYNPMGMILDGSVTNPLWSSGALSGGSWATSGGTWAVTTRTLPNQQSRNVATCTLAASATHYIYDDLVNGSAAAWSGSTRLQEGDYVYGVAEVELTNSGGTGQPSGITTTYMQVVENNGATTVDARSTMGTITNAVWGSSGTTVLTFMTPPIPIRTYAGSGTPSVFTKVVVGTASAPGTDKLNVRRVEVRKWFGEI